MHLIPERWPDPYLPTAARATLQAPLDFRHLMAPAIALAKLQQGKGLEDRNLPAAETIDPQTVIVAEIVT